LWGKNRRKKERKKLFYFHTNIVTKKWGKKRAKQFIQKPTNSAIKNVGKKIVGKKGEKNVIYIQTNNVTNKRGENARNKFSETHE